MRSGDKVRLEGVVSGRVFGSRGGGKVAQILQDGALRLLEEQLAESREIDAADFGIERIAGVEAPAIAPGLAFVAVLDQGLERLAKRLEFAEGIQ